MNSNEAEVLISIDRTKSLLEEPGTGHNRWHPEIPPIAAVRPGQVVAIETRDAMDGQITSTSTVDDYLKADLGRVHPLTGPLYVEGADPGDLLEVKIVDVLEQDYGFGIQYHSFGILSEYSPGPFLAHFEIADGFA